MDTKDVAIIAYMMTTFSDFPKGSGHHHRLYDNTEGEFIAYIESCFVGLYI